MTHEEMKKNYLEEADLHIKYGEKLKEFVECEDPIKAIPLSLECISFFASIEIFNKKRYENLKNE